jgi:hypothetical protein
MFSYTEFQINTDNRAISGMILGYGIPHPTKLSEQSNRWLQNKISDNDNILLANEAKIIHSKPGSVSFQVPDTFQLIQCILYNNFIPTELRKIVNTYYGEDGPIENLMYSLLAKLVHDLHTNILNKYTLPYENYSPKEFTGWLYYRFPISIKYIGGLLCLPTCKESIISPKLFYKFYKDVNKLGVDFVAPAIDKNAAPSLIPLRRSWRTSDTYELSTEYPDD